MNKSGISIPKTIAVTFTDDAVVVILPEDEGKRDVTAFDDLLEKVELTIGTCLGFFGNIFPLEKLI